MLGGLFSSNLGRGVSGEIRTEAFKIEAAEDLDSSAKGNVSLGEMELERLKVHIFCPQQFLTDLSLFFFLVCAFSLSAVFLTGGKNSLKFDPQFLLLGLWESWRVWQGHCLWPKWVFLPVTFCLLVCLLAFPLWLLLTHRNTSEGQDSDKRPGSLSRNSFCTFLKASLWKQIVWHLWMRSAFM